LVKITASNLPHLYLTTPLGTTRLEFRRNFWRQTTKEFLGYRTVLFAWS